MNSDQAGCRGGHAFSDAQSMSDTKMFTKRAGKAIRMLTLPEPALKRKCSKGPLREEVGPSLSLALNESKRTAKYQGFHHA